jgi:hypothetical protein
MPSGANAARRDAQRLASLTFFLDHQIGRYQVAEMLRAAGAKVEVHLDHFLGDMPDIEWIPEVARRRWVLITKDQTSGAILWNERHTVWRNCGDSSRRVRT